MKPLPLEEIRTAIHGRWIARGEAAVIEAVVRAKPSGAKGQYIRTASLTTTMGPGIKLDLRPTLSLSTS